MAVIDRKRGAHCAPACTRPPSPTPHPQPVSGFTLLEILLALVLLAFVMLGVWGAMRGATHITHSADTLMAQSEQVRTVQQFLRRYMSAAGPQPWVTHAGAPTRMFQGDPTAMQYVAPLPQQSGHAGLYLQTVSLEKNATGQVSLWLAYRPYVGDAPTDATPVKHLLLADVRDGRFEYLAAAAYGRPGGWRGDWQAVNGLPLAVRIRIDPAWRTRVAFPTLVIPLHAGEGIGQQTGGAR
ncbi:MAG: hypothetical protein EPN36_08655 [Rhodanobacteraceae bacterium]|nr:MAG: hypothetical protein EPN36_08655 [Rhodanobacteraceae bacterium]